MVRNGGKVKNLTLKNSSITGGDATGGIVGRLMFGCLVENCHVESDVTISGNNYAGGVVGFSVAGTIRACSSAATVSGRNYLGGIAGACEPASTVENCLYYGGDIEGTSVGAIVGYEISTSSATLPSGTSLDYNYLGNLYYTTASIKGVNGSDKDGAERGYKVTSGTEGLTLKYSDSTSIRYDNDRIVKIGNGLLYKGTYYGKAGGSVNIVGSVTEGTITKLETTTGTLTGALNTYKLTFAEDDAVITATVADELIEITLFDQGEEAAGNTEIITENDEKLANVTLSGRKLFKDGDWNTLCLPFDFVIEGSPLEGATIKVLDGANSSFDQATGTLTLSFADYTEPTFAAGTTCLVKWDATTPAEVENPVFNGVVIKDVEPAATSTSDNAATFVGNYSPYTTEEDNTVLYLGSGSTLYWPNSAMTFGAFRAYFKLNDGVVGGDPAGSVRAFMLNFGDGTTGIEMIKGKSDDAKWYDLSGRRVSAPAKGVYIVNGRKVLVK